MAKHHSSHHGHKEGGHSGMHHRSHEQHMHVHHHKKKGGRVGMRVAGNPDVFEEADEKRGGRVKKKARGGKVIGLMTGGGVRPRLDRPGRKVGGAVGANKSPLSTAHSGSHGPDGSSSPEDSYGGTPD